MVISHIKLTQFLSMKRNTFIRYEEDNKGVCIILEGVKMYLFLFCFKKFSIYLLKIDFSTSCRNVFNYGHINRIVYLQMVSIMANMNPNPSTFNP